MVQIQREAKTLAQDENRYLNEGGGGYIGISGRVMCIDWHLGEDCAFRQVHVEAAMS